MPLNKVVSREEWNAARKELLAKEKEVTHARERLSDERRQLPFVQIHKDYTFEGPSGSVRMIDVFEGRSQLIVHHFMFHPDWDEGCPSCSFLADNVGHLSHLHAANTTIAFVSRAPYWKLERYKNRMGWSVPWYSSHDSEFNYDFHATLDPSIAPVEYNYRNRSELEQEMGPIPPGGIEVPGTSVFFREGHEVFHTYSTFSRGTEMLLNTFNFLDLTPLGRQEEAGIMNWLRRHDVYDDARLNARSHD